jgi:preprotein translocase subunit SecA
MHASLAELAEPRLIAVHSRAMSSEMESKQRDSRPTESQHDPSPSADSSADVQTKRAIRELLDVLPADVLDEINRGVIDLKDPAFLDGLMDHVSRLSLASPREGQRILGKVIKLKKLISRSLRDSDPQVAVSPTITRTGQRVGRNDACPCGSGKKYKQCCLRKQPH